MRALRGFAVSRSIGQISTLVAGHAIEGFSTAIADIIELSAWKPNFDRADPGLLHQGALDLRAPFVALVVERPRQRGAGLPFAQHGKRVAVSTRSWSPALMISCMIG
jgi:hypothetical protein